MKYKAIRDGINAAQKKAEKLSLNLEDAKVICFSDHHRGKGDGADDFRVCRQTYLTALDYYLERGYILILLGDVEELWESKAEDVFKEYKYVYDKESLFHKQNRLIRVWGNHDDSWRFSDMVQKYFGDQFKDLIFHESIDLSINDNGNRIGNILFLHGHQGTLMSAKLAGFSKFFVRLFFRPLQRLFKFSLSTARSTPKLRYKTDKAMNLWAKIRSRQLIVCGHTHQYLFGSLAIKTDEKPCYFNSGACSYGNGNISGIEISNEKIRLIEWNKTSSEPYYIAKNKLKRIFDLCE